VGYPEAGDHPTHGLIPSEDVDRSTGHPIAIDQTLDEIGEASCVSEHGHGTASGIEGPFHNEITFGEESSGPGVIATFGPIRKGAFVEPELSEGRILKGGNRDDHSLHQ
jgi:hypothetical protein